MWWGIRQQVALLVMHMTVSMTKVHGGHNGQVGGLTVHALEPGGTEHRDEVKRMYDDGRRRQQLNLIF